MVFQTIISWFSKKFGTLFPNNSTGAIKAQPPAHPLLRLPDHKIIEKLRRMSLEEILQFSLISERCKELVTSMQIKAISFSVSIDSRITVKIKKHFQNHNRFKFYTEPDMYWETGAHGQKKKLTAPQSVRISERDPMRTRSFSKFTLSKNDLSIQDWLKHLQDIFNYHKIDYIRFCEYSSEFDIDDIKEVFGNTTDVRIVDTGCLVFNQMILRKFFPIEKLQIKASSFRDSKISKGILIQNFVDLSVVDEMEETIYMPLNELLLINSKHVFIGSFQMFPKELNKFIKLWQRGSNPHLEYLRIDFEIVSESDIYDNEGDKEVIMKGINHQVIPASHKRKFKATGNKVPEEIEGGMDIFRMDGVKATIHYSNIAAFEMFIWFDHCFVES